VLIWLVLGILLFYSYIDFFQHPYGFSWDTNGTVLQVFVNQSIPTLKVGDQIVQVGALSWKAFHADLTRTFFEGVQPGQITPVEVERNGQLIIIPWRLPGFNEGELLDQLTGQWFFAYSFWLAGLLTVIFLHPPDERWRLMVAFDFLTAVWLIAGSGPSNYHLAYSALVMRMAIWLCVPVYLHFHWVFPRSLGRWPPLFVQAVYVAAVGLAIAQWFQLLPESSYVLGFLLAVVGSLVLLVVHFIRQTEVRRSLRFLLVVTLFGLLPAIFLGITSLLSPVFPFLFSLAFVSFAGIPFAYLYIVYRREWSGLQLRMNRIISAYFFIVLLGMIGTPLLAWVAYTLPPLSYPLVLGPIAALCTALLSIWVFPYFQRFIERYLLGIEVAPEQIQDAYSSRSAESSSIHALMDLVREIMLPSLLVRQFLFLQFEDSSVKVLLAVGLDENQIPGAQGAPELSALNGIRSDHPGKLKPYPWVRLVLPLKVGKKVIGAWLFGRRDPDDFYSQSELPVLRSLANQTAIAISNILQTERLRAIYEADINRYEQERLNLAHELHDSILNQMAAMLMNDTIPLSPNFQEAYNDLIERLREIVSDLRPPMLHYGLKPAIEELADNLMERGGDTVRFLVYVEAGDGRYSENVERNVYRIVQQACENALQHGKAGRISIVGSLDDQAIELEVEDDGVGFDVDPNMELDDMLANKHFGIAGMIERAMLIGGRVNIDSAPNAGTRVRLLWNADHAGL